MNIARVTRALNQAIENCASEREGLSQRLADVTSRAAIVAGNDTDEYLERERAVSDQLSALDSEVKNAQRRLEELAYNIAQFERLREDLRSRFSQYALAETGRHEMVGVGTPVDAR